LSSDDENFKRCVANLAPYGKRAIVKKGGIWSHCCHLTVTSATPGEGQEWAITVSEAAGAGPGTIEAFDLPALASLAGPPRDIDLLKVDIEGSERQVFSGSCREWLPRVKNICIELHGPDCDEVFFGALGDYRYDVRPCGELTICTGLRPK
jgi:FkbM family methyltransferase